MSRFKGDEIVISGISGCFPDTENTHQLSDKLFSKIDMVTKCDQYADIKHPESPQYLGKMKGMEKFDAQFFRVTRWQAETLDPVGRKVMEQAFSAIFDAGINPETLKGTKVGVFISSMQSDTITFLLYNVFKRNGFIISGCSRTMLANRISYWLDGKGPSYGFDSGCAGSSAALEMAYNRMKSGEIDCAIVGGCNFCIHPLLDINMKRAGLLCLDGKTKCFDKNGDGYVRSDAINVYFLQKAKDAKRIYTQVYHVKGKYFTDPDGSFSLKRDPKDVEKFLKEFYSEAKVLPSDVEYIEANGFGIAEADGNELEAIGSVFGKDKSIMIGSVKSNMGNTEGASGACSVTKMCLAYQKGQIPANLHFSDPLNDIQAVKDGKVKVVTEHVPFHRGFTAINNFCYTGSNFHVLLKGYFKPKNLERYKCTIPRLILISARQEESVNKMLDILESNPIDPEQYALLNNFFKSNVAGLTGRGYTILDLDENQKTRSLFRSFEFYSGHTRPLWFLYSGMGSQWAGMGEDFLRLPVFAAAIERCNNVLLPKGIDIVKIITNKDNGSLNILNSLLAITAMQIGITDVLKSINIVPDNIIGHSVGELASAYADGSLTTEETILTSYSRAIISYETPFIKGKMAAIGLGHTEVGKLCPPEIQVACHNSSESATISGPADIVTEFVKNLTEKGIFAKEVASSNIAFHSRYIAKAGPPMLALQKQFIKEPKLRSNKWLSTCYLPEDWHKPESKYASAEYFTHNLMSSVLFEEAANLIPDDAIIIEIAPHGLLQAIMKRSHSKCMNISLTRRGEKDSVKLLLATIGKLYQAGLNPDLDALYPKVEFPVSTETPLLSHFVGWEHSEDWLVEKYDIDEPIRNMNKKYILSIHNDDYAFLSGHIRNGTNVLPEAAVLVFVWDTLAKYVGKDYEDLPVVFNDIKFYNEIVIMPEETLKLDVAIQKGSSRFEVINKNSVVADGFIHLVAKTDKKCGKIAFSENESQLNQNDIYTILETKGYSYQEEFKSIKSANLELNKATINWNGNWITFLDSIIQLSALSKNHDGVSTVKLLNKLTINIDEHEKYKSETSEGVHSYLAVVLRDIGETKCGGVIFEDIVFNDFPKSEVRALNLNTLQFVPHNSSHVDLYTALKVNLQVISENVRSNVIKIKEIGSEGQTTLSDILTKLSQEFSLPLIKTELIDAKNYEKLIKTKLINPDVVIFNSSFKNNELIEKISDHIATDTFILTLENGIIAERDLNFKMKIITIMHVSDQTMVLMRKEKRFDLKNTGLVSVQTLDEKIITKLKNEIDGDKNIILLVKKMPQLCIQRLCDVIRNKNISLFLIDAEFSNFKITNNYYKMQIQKGLKVNILENGKWGSYIYTPGNAKHTEAQNIMLIAKELNNVESLAWTEAPVMSNRQTVQICYSGLSTKDCTKLSENNNNDSGFGMDFSGIDSRGNRVMGLLPQGAVSSTVEADCDLLWPVPQHWSLAEAATVPLPYVHAFYCLAIRCSLYRNNNVFVMGAAGALGQAVISVALSLGCTVFGTVGNADKKKFLLKLFPKLDENNIGYTYEAACREMVASRTKNKRCNIVINCGTENIRESAMGCVGYMKYFLDLNDRDKKENRQFPMFYLEEDRVYKAVNLSNIFFDKYYQNKKELQVMLSEGIAKGFVRPLTSVVYAPSDISRAFKLLSNRSNRGRVLINMKDPVVPNIKPRITLSSTNTYIIVCDGTDLSVGLIDFLTQRGARNFLVHCNPKLLSGYFHYKYASWIRLGVTVEFSSNDLHTESGCLKFMEDGNKLGPIDGIFIIKNDLDCERIVTLEQMYEHTALTASNLDKASHKCKELRYFVVIAATLRNVLGENEVEEIEKCCLLRKEIGKPSLFLRYILNETKLQRNYVSALLNAMESSLKHKYVSVLTSNSTIDDVDMPLCDVTKPEANTHFDAGLKAFYTHILEDEITATEPIVRLKTSSIYKHELSIDLEDTYLMIVPGFEGHYKMFDSVSETIKNPAIVLQLDPDLNDSIPEMAKRLLNHIKKRFYIKSPFYLLGYSFGVDVAIEIALLLEKEGLVGVVCCLDSSPDALRVHLDAYLGDLTDEQLQNSIVEHFYKLLAGHESEELKNILEETTKWSDKINVFNKKIRHCTSHSHEYVLNLLQAAYDRIKMAKEYKPTLKLESELVLIKGIRHPNAEHLNDDYNLSKYTDKPVQVFAIESDHALAPFDSRVSNLINRMFVS